MSYAKAQFFVGLGIPCSIIAAVIYRWFFPGDWAFQHGQIVGVTNAYIMLRIVGRASLRSPGQGGG